MDEKTLFYIHIGKCGGTSLEKAILKNPVIRNTFTRITKIHVIKPPVFEQARYLIVIRNPIKRAISAFNWRYHLVVETQAQRDRFEGEYDILKRYQTLSTIAESLYTEGVLNPRVVAEFQSIHHLRENMAFYLADFLEQVHPAQIFGVLSTESLTADARIQLGIDDLPKIYVHGSLVPSEKKILRENGYNNIKNYLASDYECLRRLLALNHTTKTSSRVLLR